MLGVASNGPQGGCELTQCWEAWGCGWNTRQEHLYPLTQEFYS